MDNVAIHPHEVHDYVIAAMKGIRIRAPFSQHEDLKRLMNIVKSYGLVHDAIEGENGDIIYNAVNDELRIDPPEQCEMFAGFNWEQAIKGILFSDMPNITPFTELSFVVAEKTAYERTARKNGKAAVSH